MRRAWGAARGPDEWALTVVCAVSRASARAPDSVSGLSAPDVAALVTAALLVGFAKTALGGVGLISVALFASVLPARQSTGALLVLLLVGDVIAVLVYRRHADWPALLRLVRWVVVGVVVGVAFLAVAGDETVRRTIGMVLLLLVGVHLLRRHVPRPVVRGYTPSSQGSSSHPSRRRTVPPRVFGALAGFTTMVANAGGPVMSLYLLAARLDKLAFLGTSAWFFLVVNAFKVPLSVALGLVDRDTLLLDAALVPAVLVGAGLGLLVVQRIPQVLFEQAVLVLTVLAAINLMR